MERREFLKLGALFTAYALAHKHIEALDYILKEFQYQAPTSNQRMFLYFMKNAKGQNKIRATKHLDLNSTVGMTGWQADTFIPLEVTTLNLVNERKAYYWEKYNCHGWMTKYNWEKIHKGNLKTITERHKESQELYSQVAELHAQGLSTQEIADKTGLSRVTVTMNALKSRNLKSNWVLDNEERDNQMLSLFKRGYSFNQIAEELDLEVANVNARLRKMGIKSKHWKSLMDHTAQKDKEILDLYHNGTKPINSEIKRITGHDNATVSKTLKKHNLRPWDYYHAEVRDAKILEGHSLGLSSKDIAKHAGISNHVTVLNVLKRNNLRPNPNKFTAKHLL